MQRISAALAAVALAGCVAPPPDDDAAAFVAAATDGAATIVVCEASEPLDVAVDAAAARTLAAAVGTALQHDAGLQASLAQARAALLTASRMRQWPNPLLAVAVRFGDGASAPQIDLGLTAELLALLQRPARARAADARFRVACGNAVQTALDVVAAVQSSWFRLQALEAEAPIAAARVEAAAALARLAQTRVDNGDGTRLEAIEFASLRKQCELDAARTTQEAAAEQLRLLRLLGRPGGDAIVVATAWQPPTANVPPVEDCVGAALRRRPDLAAMAVEFEALGGDVDAAGLGWLEGAALGASSQRDGGWTTGPAANVPLPLFSGSGAARDEASAGLLAARQRAVARGREVIEAVRVAHSAVAAADDRRRCVDDELLPMQRLRRDLADKAWRNGDADRSVLLRAEQDLASAESQAIAARRDVWLARIELERAVGGAAALRAAAAARLTSRDRPTREEREQ